MVVLRDKPDISKDYGYSIISPHFSLPFWSSSPSYFSVRRARLPRAGTTVHSDWTGSLFPPNSPNRHPIAGQQCARARVLFDYYDSDDNHSSNANHTLELERMAADDCWLRVAMTALALDQARACRVWYLLFPCPPCCPNGPYGNGPLA